MLDIFTHFMPQPFLDRLGTLIPGHPVLAAFPRLETLWDVNARQFLVEYGWGGRTIDPATWTPHERTEGPSLWGHDRAWLSPEGREQARDMRIRVAEAGGRVPLNVMDGNHKLAADTCPWWTMNVTARQTGS